MIRQKILTTSQGTGCRVVCAHSLEQFDKRHLALNAIAKSQSTTVRRLLRLTHELQLNVLNIKVSIGYTTSFIERNTSEILLAAFKQECEKRMARKRAENPDARDIQAVKRYLHNITQSQQPLPRRGNRLNKVAIAQASGISRNAIYDIKEIQKLLEDHTDQDTKLHGVKIGSQLQIPEEYPRSATDSVTGPPLMPNGRPNKKRIAQEAGVSREVFYKNGNANKLLEQYLSA